MRVRLLLSIALALGAAACGSSSASSSPSASAGANGCAKSNLQLVNPGQLTIGTDNPAYDPYFQGPTGHAWTGQFNHDPYNDQGFEDAVAYAVAQKLGFSKPQVQWDAVPFNNSYKPGPKNFDFYLAQVSYSPVRAKGADLSAYYMANVQLGNGVVVGTLPSASGAKEHFSLVLQKGSSLTPCVNAALSTLRSDGTLAQIQDRWLNQAAHAPALQ